MAGCGGNKQSTEDFITVDVTKTYSQKKELILQDFMDVEYILLDTNDDFLHQGLVKDIGKKFIIVKNRILHNGDIFVYDRNGKPLHKINRKGESGEEYLFAMDIVLDEEKNEIYINDVFKRMIIVYDIFGNFKRSFRHREGVGSKFYQSIFNYNKDNLICYDELNEESVFAIISKQDGSITKEIKTPFKEKKMLGYKENDSLVKYPSIPTRTINPYNGNWILLNLSSDTIYTLLPDYTLNPLIVRVPSIKSMNPEVFLLLKILSDRYYFMETIKNEYNFITETGFFSKSMVYDKQEKAFYGYTVYNGDYSIKKEVDLTWFRPVNHEIDSWEAIAAHQLVEDYKEGILKDGKLKEIASKLNEEDNPVIMLIKHKK